MLGLPPEEQTHEEYKVFLREQESQLRIGYSTHIIDPENQPNYGWYRKFEKKRF